eukprot:6196725-Pleurochrysis_carterae.AAC.3
MEAAQFQVEQVGGIGSLFHRSASTQHEGGALEFVTFTPEASPSIQMKCNARCTLASPYRLA